MTDYVYSHDYNFLTGVYFQCRPGENEKKAELIWTRASGNFQTHARYPVQCGVIPAEQIGLSGPPCLAAVFQKQQDASSFLRFLIEADVERNPSGDKLHNHGHYNVRRDMNFNF